MDVMNPSMRSRKVWIRFLCLSMALAGCGSGSIADQINLGGGASITGSVLAEKTDHIIVDIGYTVLAIPREQIVSVLNDDAEPDADRAAESEYSEIGLYREAQNAPDERTVRELVRSLGSAVVQVRTPGGLGSGFFINEGGYLITNFHVIENETQISVEVYGRENGQMDRHSYKDVRIVAMNKFADLALLRIEDSGAPQFPWVPLGATTHMEVGERLFAIGSPLGLERTVTEGILSTKTRQIEGSLFLQTTTQINPGNSGGPLFNLRGEVIGVTNMKMTFGEGLGFAIPIEAVKFFLRHREAYAYDNDNPSNPYRYLQPPRKLHGESGSNTKPDRAERESAVVSR